MRLFVAVNFPPELRRVIERECAPLREASMPVRWVKREQIHLTVKFIGEVSSSGVEGFCSVLDQVAARSRPFDLRFGNVGAFPSPRRPRVLWLGVDPCPELLSLKDGLERGLAEVGVPPEERRYHPHVTLGRALRSAGAGDFDRFETVARTLGLAEEYRVTHLALMESRLRPSGAVHCRLRAAPLGPDGARA